MTNPAELRETFDHFDSDGDGAIDAGEFGRILTALGAGADSEEEARIGFESIDTDGSGTIQFNEFRTWWDAR